jgi:nickel-dependent lactate racemase
VIIPIPYGKTQLELRLPDDLDVTVLDPRETPPDPDPVRAVREAIEAADWSSFAGARTAAIAINDKTRPVPHDILLPPLLEKIEA